MVKPIDRCRQPVAGMDSSCPGTSAPGSTRLADAIVSLFFSDHAERVAPHQPVPPKNDTPFPFRPVEFTANPAWLDAWDVAIDRDL